MNERDDHALCIPGNYDEKQDRAERGGGGSNRKIWSSAESAHTRCGSHLVLIYGWFTILIRSENIQTAKRFYIEFIMYAPVLNIFKAFYGSSTLALFFVKVQTSVKRMMKKKTETWFKEELQFSV
jgi:hypothetical protein